MYKVLLRHLREICRIEKLSTFSRVNEPYLRFYRLGLLYSTHQVIGDVMLIIMGLNWRSPEDGVERRTPSKSKYQFRYRYLHNKGSIHTEKTRRLAPVYEI